MSGVSSRRGSRSAGPQNVLYLCGAALVLIALAVVAYQVFLTTSVTIDGVRGRFGVGTKIADLLSGGKLHGHAGDLIAAKDHRILRAGGGAAPTASVNGHLAAAAEGIVADAVILSVDGSDTVEPLASRVETYTVPTHYEGTGSVEVVIFDGKPGRRKVTYGSISHQVVRTKTLVAAEAPVVVRHSPGGGEKVVALTFDDGPWPTSTQQILDILKENDVKATFFMIGGQAKERPALAKAVNDAGMLIGNHSETHPYNILKFSAARVKAEIDQAEADITAASGQRPRYFRPPGGLIDKRMWPILAADKMKLVNWDIDPNDWRRPPAAQIINRVLRHVSPGAVVLMHDGGGNRSHTVAALPEIIRRLKAAGYRFVTLDGIATLPGGQG